MYSYPNSVFQLCVIPEEKNINCACILVERSGSGGELRTIDYDNPGSNPGCGVKTLGKLFHSTLFQFTQLNQNE